MHVRLQDLVHPPRFQARPSHRDTLVADASIWRTRDEGGTWNGIHVGLPDKWASRVAASSHDPDRVYAAFPGFREDDFRAYLFPSGDAGDSWQSITANLPGGSVNVIAEDPDAPGVVYVGTDPGVYVALGDGGAWHSLSARLPTIPVHDLEVHASERELIIGTHGRSVFVLELRACIEAGGC